MNSDRRRWNVITTEKKWGGDGVGRPVDRRIDTGQERFTKNAIITLEFCYYQVRIVNEIGSKLNDGVRNVLGSGIESTIGKADTEGVRKVGQVEAVGFGKGKVNKVTASTRVNKERTGNTIYNHFDGEEFSSIVGGRGGVKMEDRG